jgi:hypothetical protein
MIARHMPGKRERKQIENGLIFGPKTTRGNGVEIPTTRTVLRKLNMPTPPAAPC